MGFARSRQASNNPPSDVPSSPPVDNPRGGSAPSPLATRSTSRAMSRRWSGRP